MLTLVEKLLFILLTILSLTYAWITFGYVFGVIGRGKGQLPSLAEMKDRVVKALTLWLSEGSIWKARKVSSVFHLLIAWGFTFYFLVNFGDLVQGFFPITFLGEGFVGDLYRLLADLFTASVLVGMLYFLLRRFVFHSPALRYHENVRLVEAVRKGAIRRDSLIVGLFILLHVGFRLLGESFAVAAEGNDPFRPISTLVAQAWSGWELPALEVAHHLCWWVALGLILLFIPYFPFSKHFHLIMSGVNFLTKPQRT
jgi:hypothetical protein